MQILLHGNLAVNYSHNVIDGEIVVDSPEGKRTFSYDTDNVLNGLVGDAMAAWKESKDVKDK